MDIGRADIIFDGRKPRFWSEASCSRRKKRRRSDIGADETCTRRLKSDNIDPSLFLALLLQRNFPDFSSFLLHKFVTSWNNLSINFRNEGIIEGINIGYMKFRRFYRNNRSPFEVKILVKGWSWNTIGEKVIK